MNSAYVSLLRAASRPLQPIPTDQAPQLVRMSNIACVLFDVYGTLLVSGSGDVGSADPGQRGTAAAAALQAMGWGVTCPPGEVSATLGGSIEAIHAELRTTGIDFPEVEIREVWRRTCARLEAADHLRGDATAVDWGRLAIEFEVRANPAWPMPAAARCLESLAAGGRVLGIISNAQFFTPLLFPATLGKTLDELGFDARLRYYSYEHQRAKPSTWLYERAAEQLAKLGIRAADTLYVGNDIRNDVWPATRVGFRTVLFAGDRRSLRLRTEDRATAERDVGAAGYPPPDAVVTDLAQIAQLVG